MRTNKQPITLESFHNEQAKHAILSLYDFLQNVVTAFEYDILQDDALASEKMILLNSYVIFASEKLNAIGDVYSYFKDDLVSFEMCMEEIILSTDSVKNASIALLEDCMKVSKGNITNDIQEDVSNA